LRTFITQFQRGEDTHKKLLSSEGYKTNPTKLEDSKGFFGPINTGTADFLRPNDLPAWYQLSLLISLPQGKTPLRGGVAGPGPLATTGRLATRLVGTHRHISCGASNYTSPVRERLRKLLETRCFLRMRASHLAVRL
jgi:hypothetical protein